MKTNSTPQHSAISDRLADVSTALLVLLFCYAAASKVIAFQEFREQMSNQTFPPEIAGMLVYFIPATEIAAVFLLANGSTRKLGLCISALLILAFTGYIGLVLLGSWDRIPCSCGGILNSMSWTAHLVFNLFFLAIALFALIKTTTGQAENLRKE